MLNEFKLCYYSPPMHIHCPFPHSHSQSPLHMVQIELLLQRTSQPIHLAQLLQCQPLLQPIQVVDWVWHGACILLVLDYPQLWSVDELDSYPHTGHGSLRNLLKSRRIMNKIQGNCCIKTVFILKQGPAPGPLCRWFETQTFKLFTGISEFHITRWVTKLGKKLDLEL